MSHASLHAVSGFARPLAANLSSADILFVFLFIFRYLRFVVHFVTGCFLYKPAPKKENPRYTNRDVAVIIPTVAPYTKDFLKCLATVLVNRPLQIIICGVGEKMKSYMNDVIDAYEFRGRFPETEIIVVNTSKANKRKQVARASRDIDPAKTPITIHLDDHVYWKANLLAHLITPFEDPAVGIIGTNKRVIRTKGRSFWQSYTNFLACLYLVRHNFQIRSEPYVDGGVFVVSGRTYAIRTSILHNKDFRNQFLNENYLFGLRGPLNVGEDNCITRWIMHHGWKIQIQYTQETQILTPLGNPATFYGQVCR